ncbi:MAG: glycosyltransferase family 4 protein [Sphingobacteriales bacterium]|nr:glycosyltransferase family 4 protein [Sphingobacteriales bacterium]MBI3720848.1 glycosyltransferase family 4 protein [Sphingobacteriales bacterium]
MKVLFVCSGNSPYFPISPFTKAQGESLVEKGIEVDYFPIKGKGISSYLKHIFMLRKLLRQKKYDVIHAHYTLSGWVAVLARFKTPVILSLMGDDAQGAFKGKNKIAFKSRFFIWMTYCIQPFVKAIISKSAGIEKTVYRKKISHIVPNGVKMDKFINCKNGFRDELGLSKDKKYILFLGSSTDLNKNFILAKEAVKILNDNDVNLINIYKESSETVAKYLNSADVFVLCSFAEGSANVVKEAMACNCPMVVTNAGDAAWVIGDEPGCYVSEHAPEKFAADLSKALNFGMKNGRTKGRERIFKMGLDAGSIANKLIDIYTEILP